VIARANPGLDPNRLLIGQVIKLPAAKQTAD
jgi:LysM repeat protein